MDVRQVEKCQEMIRDDMVRYKTALDSIKAISNDVQLDSSARIQTIKHICAVALPNK